MVKKKVEEQAYSEAPLKIPREKFCDLLRAQIKKGQELLCVNVPQMPHANPSYGGFIAGRRGNEYVKYNDKEKNAFVADYSRWNDRNKTIYRTSFIVADNIYFHNYEGQIWDKLFCKDIIKDYKDEITRLINQMQSDIERVDLISCQVEEYSDLQVENKPQGGKQTSQKTPMVFISHSSKDRAFVEALVDLLENIGFNDSNLFCSSIDGYGIGLSENIFETLFKLFNEHDLFVMFIHSPRYYNSPISLNEMGAAWVLKTDFCSFLTTDMDFSQMKGVVNDQNISIKVDADDTPSRLTELKDKLIRLFGFSTIDSIKWERKRKSFLCTVKALVYENKESQIVSVDDEYKQLQNEILWQEVIARKQAKIRGNIVKSSTRGSRILRIFNAGKATARSVYVEWLNPDDGVIVQWDFGLIGDITPQNNRSYQIALTMGHHETMRLRYSWADDYQEHNEFNEELQL